MNAQIATVMQAAEGRYLTDEEMEQVLASARAYEHRLAVMKELEKHEDFIVRRTVEKSLEQFPVFQAERPQAYDKGRRDTTLVLRYAALSWVNEDPEIFTEKVLYWMQTIVASMGFCDVAKFTYTYMQQLVSESLDDEAGVQGINRYLQMVVDVMEQ